MAGLTYVCFVPANGTSNAMFAELAERSLMSPLAGTKHTYVRLATIVYIKISLKYVNLKKKRTLENYWFNSTPKKIRALIDKKRSSIAR